MVKVVKKVNDDKCFDSEGVHCTCTTILLMHVIHLYKLDVCTFTYPPKTLFLNSKLYKRMQ
jgi:hypothetical protein